jgi:hypothetical protein
MGSTSHHDSSEIKCLMSIYYARQLVKESSHIEEIAILSQIKKESIFQSNTLELGGRSHEVNLIILDCGTISTFSHLMMIFLTSF